MASKYIPNKNNQQKTKQIKIPVEKLLWSHYMTDRSSSVQEEIKREKQELLEESKFLKSEKKRIESMELNELTFLDLYEFPFTMLSYGSQVYDSKDNFIFQFESGLNKEHQKLILLMINDENQSKIENKVYSINGDIFMIDDDGLEKHIMTIRGWGNLTGSGAYNLDPEYATKIQDSLEEFIIKKISINQ